MQSQYLGWFREVSNEASKPADLCFAQKFLSNCRTEKPSECRPSSTFLPNVKSNLTDHNPNPKIKISGPRCEETMTTLNQISLSMGTNEIKVENGRQRLVLRIIKHLLIRHIFHGWLSIDGGETSRLKNARLNLNSLAWQHIHPSRQIDLFSLA